MSKSKRITIITIIFLISSLSFSVFANDKNEIIYENQERQIITQGVSHRNINRFTENGWVNINIIETDTNNQYLDFKVLTDERGMSYLNDIKDLTSNETAVAAINGDFFQKIKGVSDRGSSIGAVVKEGKVLTSTAKEEKMSVAALNNQNQLLFDYWNFDITITAPNGEQNEVKHINKYDPLDSIILYDSNWGEYSQGSYDNKVEVVVVDNVVKEIRKEMDPVKIPENGYILCNLPEYNSFLTDNLKVGDKVNLDVESSINLKDIKYAMGAGTILVKNGLPHKITHNIKGLHPRTVLGTDKTGKIIYFITIDGRQLSSMGIKLDELTDFLIDEGIYNAVNLDGGGSTAMLAKPLGEDNLSVINSLSDGWLRNIPNAPSIVSSAPKTSLSGLIIEAPSENVFVDTSIKLRVRGYDSFYNYSYVDTDRVKWSCQGVSGYFKDSTFYPTSYGRGYITATINGISQTKIIDVLSSPHSIELTPVKNTLSKNDTIQLNVIGKNKNGYFAPINPQDIDWNVENKLGIINSQGIFTAKKSGAGIITASIGDVNSHSAVFIDTNTPVYEFEDNLGKFLSYPSFVEGDYEISSIEKKSGNYSGKLTYDFTSEENASKAAYIMFGDKGISINKNVKKIGLWVYGSDYMEHWLRGMLKDSNGNPIRVNFDSKIDWNGWKYVEAKLPRNLPDDVRLTRIYIVQIHPEIKNKGTIYFDDLTFVYDSDDSSSISLPEDVKKSDELNKQFSNENNKYNFTVFGNTINPKTLLDNLVLSKLIYRFNDYSDLAGFATNTDVHAISDLKTPYFNAKGYYSFEKSGSTFMYMDNSNDGFRKTNPEQWSWFVDTIQNINNKNVFILLPDDLSGFSDTQEAQLFKTMLTEKLAKTGKNVFVFYPGPKTKVNILDGVRYCSVTGMENLTKENTLDKIDNFNYFIISINNNQVSYDIKNIFE